MLAGAPQRLLLAAGVLFQWDLRARVMLMVSLQAELAAVYGNTFSKHDNRPERFRRCREKPGAVG